MQKALATATVGSSSLVGEKPAPWMPLLIGRYNLNSAGSSSSEYNRSAK